MNDHTAQLCLRIVQWLEGLASKALDLESKVINFQISLVWLVLTSTWSVIKLHSFIVLDDWKNPCPPTLDFFQRILSLKISRIL